ncbi:MAG: hypothetical protein IJG52_04740 [Lachnospiraceae bacterium]|nr:hypothetical protein [Lachnospiraceae bacterium]
MRKFLRRIFQNMGLPIMLAASVIILTAVGFAGRNTIYAPYAEEYEGYPPFLAVIGAVHDRIWPWQLVMGGGKDQEMEAEEEETPSEEEIPVPGEELVQNDSAVEIPPLDNSFEGPVDGPMPEGICNEVMQAEDYGVASLSFLSTAETEYNTDTEGMFARNGRYFKLRAVDSSYFADALFIGDSRTVGLCEYGGMKGKANFLAKESVNVYNILDTELRYTNTDGDSWGTYMEDVLRDGHYRKVYMCLGVNELGIGTTHMYYEKYRELVEMIRENQPDAIIYIEGIMHVSKRYSSSDSARNNTVIVQRNEAIATLANGYDIFYIDMNPYVCEENGDLISDLTGDGIHLKASAYENWDRSLFENAIVRDHSDYSGEEEPVFGQEEEESGT